MRAIAFLYVLSWCNLLRVSRCADTQLPCGASSRKTNFKFSVISRRNLTGNWIAHMSLEHDDGPESGQWEVDIDHTTVTCDGRRSILVTNTVVAPLGKPAPGYELVPGLGYYKFYKIGKSWWEAQATCVEEGAYLIIPNSDQEFEAVKKIWDRFPSPYTDWRKNHVFMGVSDIAREGHFMSVLGETLNSTGYLRWSSNQPDGGRNEDCLVLTVNSFLHDTACAAEVAFICERGL
ncbi:hemolymph lipopolysaccharide-binding protein-like [Zootermopsis nevadensis]|uniref:Hemolymph lipopolysaccharide-binding protein n=1 Tax=Zootermopsis nevadensis TaxID=136037 RepID=A0A067QRS2_ZOONE|nr:hemolymph lipopolysaccharide-binding protein-like [Zootermopsis nevadensis]KDR07896.1 Hemolymph lipopolysaccharide-binding protein [Zootermopsis nevadensis]